MHKKRKKMKQLKIKSVENLTTENNTHLKK